MNLLDNFFLFLKRDKKETLPLLSLDIEPGQPRHNTSEGWEFNSTAETLNESTQEPPSLGLFSLEMIYLYI